MTSQHLGVRIWALFAARASLQYLAILLFAVLLCLPCLMRGIPRGYDAVTHVEYQRHFSEQFWKGELYPRWLAAENKGFGSPTFIIQYPLPYFLTALLRPVLRFSADNNREGRELGVLVFVLLSAAGLSARSWLCWLSPPAAATLAAMAYMSLPYVLAEAIYARAAIGELCALVFMPLLLALCEASHHRIRVLFPLGVSVALLILSNAVNAALFAPVLLAYAVWSGKRESVSPFRSAGIVLAALALGGGVAAAYVFPFLVYSRWFDVNRMSAALPGFEFGRHFLYVTRGSLERPAILVGLVTAALLAVLTARSVWRFTGQSRLRILMAATLLLGALALVPGLGPKVIQASGFHVSSFNSEQSWPARLAAVLFATTIVGLLAVCRTLKAEADLRGTVLSWTMCPAFLLMLPFSAPLWVAVPQLQMVQFPFRLGAILSVAVAGLLALAFANALATDETRERGATRFGVMLATLCVIAAGAATWRVDHAFLQPGTPAYSVNTDVDINIRMYVPPQELAVFAKEIGTAPDSYDVEPRPGDGSLRFGLNNDQCSADVSRGSPRELFVKADCRGEARLRIGQLFFPLWKVAGGDTSIPAISVMEASDGLIELPLFPGKHDLRLIFESRRPERWGVLVTLNCLLLALGGYAFCIFSERMSPRRGFSMPRLARRAT